jgi:retron-type reverse transcriptase
MLNFLKRLLSTGPKPGPFGADELSRRLGVSERELRAVEVAYHTFHVPKRTGGTRTIQAPAPALKAMQRRILHKLLRRLEAHPCATGFERGHSIVTNAQPHVGQELVIKLDFRDFFTATTAKRVERYFYKIGWNADAAAVLVRLCTHEGSLPQGAPTSPRLSNLVNHRLDARLFALAQVRGLAYSRYADDMTFSGPARAPALKNNPKTMEPKPGDVYRVNDIVHLVKDIVAEEGYALHTDKKLRIARRHQRQVVTGLVVNQKVQLPRKTRRWLRAVEHRLAKTGQSTLSPQQLEGWRAFHSMVRSGSA